MSKEEAEELCQKRDNEGNTALHIAAKVGNVEACKLLQEHGADLNSKNDNEMSPLQFAARYGDRSQQGGVWRCMEWIVEEKKKVKENNWKEKDRFGFTLLHLAIQNMNGGGKIDVVEGLSRMGDFSVTERTGQDEETRKRGNNCLHLAAQLEGKDENRALCAFLKMKDLKNCLQAENIQGETPLACATKAGNVDSVKRLLDLGGFDLQHPLRIAARYLIHKWWSEVIRLNQSCLQGRKCGCHETAFGKGQGKF